jgi:hypothetical protein
MRIVNSFNRVESFRSISRLIEKLNRKLAPMAPLPQGLDSDLAVLLELGRGISKEAGKKAATEQEKELQGRSLQESVENVIRVAMGMYNGVQAAEGKFLLPFDQEPQAQQEQPQVDEGVERALPEGLGVSDEEMQGFMQSEQGWMEPEEAELVTASSKREYTAKDILDEIVAASEASKSFKQIPPKLQLDKIRRYYNSGIGGAGWYDNIFGLLVKYFGEENARVFAKLLAATSPRQSVSRNMRLAIVAFTKYIRELKAKLGDRGDAAAQEMIREHFNGEIMKTLRPNVARAMISTEGLSGSKVSNFFKSIAGDKNAVTLDVWMARALGLANPGPFDDEKTYGIFANAIRELSQEAGVAPREYQAAVWSGIRKESGETKTGAPFEVLLMEMIDRLPLEAFITKPADPTSQPLFRGLAAAWLARNCRLAAV